MWEPQVAIRAWPPFRKLLLQSQLEFHHSAWSSQVCVPTCDCLCVHAFVVSHKLQHCLSLYWSNPLMPCFTALPCLSPSNHSICTFHKINDIDKIIIAVIIYRREKSHCNFSTIDWGTGIEKIDLIDKRRRITFKGKNEQDDGDDKNDCSLSKTHKRWFKVN